MHPPSERNDGAGLLTGTGNHTQIERLVAQIRATPDGNRTFLEVEEFPWVGQIESRWSAIHDELESLLPVLDLLPSLEQIQDGQYGLSSDNRWKVLPLYAYGHWSEQNARRCAVTREALRAVPGLLVAMFSILEPHKELPPHVGNYCGSLRYHLGVSIPEPIEQCGLCVGGETRHWQNGASLIFDDTHLHSAWNRSARARAVLLLDFERPLPETLVESNRAVIDSIAASDSIADAARRWQEWEAAYGARLDILLHRARGAHKLRFRKE